MVKLQVALTKFAAVFVSAITIILSPAAAATPAQVVVIRHAEKDRASGDLNEQGFRRAAVLGDFFAKDAVASAFGPPVAIYAARVKHADSARRTVQTVTPLAQSLGLPIHAEFSKRKVEALAAEILNTPEYDGRTVVVCWHHGEIPAVVQALGALNAPLSWDDATYDRAWVVQFTAQSLRQNTAQVATSVQFLDVPEHLLPGDAEE